MANDFKIELTEFHDNRLGIDSNKRKANFHFRPSSTVGQTILYVPLAHIM